MANDGETDWEGEIADLLGELSAVQDDLLAVLADKRARLAGGDAAALEALVPREEAILARLQACHRRRCELIARAADQGAGADSVRGLAAGLAPGVRDRALGRIDAAADRFRLLRHQSLANWVLAQRTLLHLSQLVEIIATGGRNVPTYGTGAAPRAAGALVDQAV
jgi:flagellar biosynthesis/type III secretory pathway chaperone